MKKISFLLIFVIFIFTFFWADQTQAAIGLVLDDYVYGPDCYNETVDFYLDIPSSYSGGKVSLRTSLRTNYNCADLGISLCSGWAASCDVNVSPGQRLNFQVSYNCTWCSPGEDDSWTVSADSVSGPVCGNGTCESGETCSNCSSDCKKCNGDYCSYSSLCQSGICLHGICRASYPYCGDDYCEGGETCSSCSTDCGSCKKSNGSSCSYGSECSDGYCVHGACRSSSYYCGDDYCDSGESCSSCYLDCGQCTKPNGSSCSSASECAGGYCVHSLCRSLSKYCGDGYCDSGESCSDCSSDCGACYVEPAKKSDGSSCASGSDCLGGYCVWGKCQSSATYCGDYSCDSGESCSGCPSDCGACNTEPFKKSDGEYCDKSEECKSGNCQNYRCCIKGKTCCLSTNNCSSGYYCDESRSYCLPGKPDGQLCAKDELCKSGNCENGICCAWGQKCCQKHGDCGSKEYCDDSLNYCKYRYSIGGKCGEKAMCNSGYCDSATWTCAELPAGTAETPVTPPSAEPAVSSETQAEINVVFVNLPPSIAIKKGETYGVSVGIWNKGRKEVVLAEVIQIDNQIPFVVDSGLKATLRVPAKKIKLLSGETVSNESKDILEAIESLNLVGKSAGSGEIRLKTVYFVGGSAKTIEAKIPTSVSYEHIDKEPTASNLFSGQMILTEKQTTIEAATSSGAAPGATTKKEIIFVEPESDNLYKETVNAWQKAQNQMDEAIQNLKDDFVGTVKPEILSFFETIEQLNEAKTQQEITAATVRALAPPTIIAGFDLANLIDAIDKKQQQEKYLLNRFGAKEFKTIPLYDERGNFIGDSRAIIKEENGKIYAIKIGDL